MILNWLVQACDFDCLPPLLNVLGLGFDIVGATLVLVPNWRLLELGIYGYGVPPYRRRVGDGLARLTAGRSVGRDHPAFSALLKMLRERRRRAVSSDSREDPTVMFWEGDRQRVTVEYEQGPDLEITVTQNELYGSFETRITNHYSGIGFLWFTAGFSLQIIGTVLNVLL